MNNATPARVFAGPMGHGPRIPNPTPKLPGPVNGNRQNKQQARAWRRNGNWDIIGVPTALLWLDELTVAAALEDDLESPEPPVVDLWP